MQVFEVEKKYVVTDRVALEERLASLGFESFSKEKLVTSYYLPGGVRLNETAKPDYDYLTFHLNRKTLKSVGDSESERLEQECEIPPMAAQYLLDQFDTTMRLVRSRVHYEHIERSRNRASVPLLSDFHIQIDTVRNPVQLVGEFVEIEVLLEPENMKYRHMYLALLNTLAAELGLSQQAESYYAMLKRLRKGRCTK